MLGDNFMVYIDQNSQIPIYIQLYEALKDDILSGAYPCGSYLPSIRKLASALCVSKNTVDNAYQQLSVEGYIKSYPGAGHVVLDTGDVSNLYQKNMSSNQENSILSTNPLKNDDLKIDFRYGDLSPEFFPNEYWRKASSHIFSSIEATKMSCYDDAKGDKSLREALSKHLKEHRGIQCDSEQIIICSGFTHSINIICDLIKNDCHSIGMEDPGFYSARDMFRYKGFALNFLRHYPTNSYFEDLSVSDTDCLYVTPSHQFPLGKVMPIDVRHRILNWASFGKRYIIEDDYDSQLRYHSRPIPSLYSLSADDKVIYVGTFSKSLSPAIRISYLVLPKHLAKKYQILPQYRHSYVSWFDQRILAKYIENGSFAKHLRKMNTICCARHDLIRDLLIEYFGDSITLLGTNAGLHMIIRLNTPTDSNILINLAKKAGIAVYSIKDCFSIPETAPNNLILIGFGKVSIEEIQQGIRILNDAWSFYL